MNRKILIIIISLSLAIILIAVFYINKNYVSANDTFGVDKTKKTKIETVHETFENERLAKLPESKIQRLTEKSNLYEGKIASVSNKHRKANEMYHMSLVELESAGYIDKLCEKNNMSKVWFDRISIIESNYGRIIPYGSYNAWGWGIYGDKVTVMGNNWYESSDLFMKNFVENYGTNPSKQAMLRYCPWGAYDKFF